MKLSWILVIVMLVLVALFSVQNAAPIHLRFIAWDLEISAALALLIAAICGGVAGLMIGERSWRKAQQEPANVHNGPLPESFRSLSPTRPLDVFPSHPTSSPVAFEERDSS